MYLKNKTSGVLIGFVRVLNGFLKDLLRAEGALDSLALPESLPNMETK